MELYPEPYYLLAVIMEIQRLNHREEQNQKEQITFET